MCSTNEAEKTEPIVISRDAGQYTGKKPPEPEKCEYCGAPLYHRGIRSFQNKKSIEVMFWFQEPERCTCEQAQEHWAKVDAEEEEKKRAEERRARDEIIQRRIANLFKQSGIRGRFRSRTFDRWEITNENRGAFKAAKRYADSFPTMLPRKTDSGGPMPPVNEKNGLFITGSYGTGKTHLATAIANQLIASGTPVIAMTMIDLLARIKQSYDDSDGQNEASIMKVYEEVPLLIIDDLGSEPPTEWGISKIYTIVNARYEAYMPVIVTTNYSVDDLIYRMTPGGKSGDSRNAEKTIDRLKEMCAGVTMFWESWRSK